ncbi:MAG: hypothetical protein KGI28_00405 [Thaumarchaeota archaeon]|nr:hypothetical protein [Nitrososphaerota archaeon]
MTLPLVREKKIKMCNVCHKKPRAEKRYASPCKDCQELIDNITKNMKVSVNVVSVTEIKQEGKK